MISKSTYVKYCSCNKKLWLHFYKKEEEVISSVLESKASDGNEVGELAKKYFPDTVDCATSTDKGIDYFKQIEDTKRYLAMGCNAIAEASFMYEDLFCAVDILKRDGDGYSIYEVKSASVLSEKYLIDVSFQKYVLEKCGLKINHIYIMHVNKFYVLKDKLDVKKFFTAECVDSNEIVVDNLLHIDSRLEGLRALIKDKNEPSTVFCSKCVDCEFHRYCTSVLPSDRFTILNGVGGSMYDLYNQGIYTIRDYINTDLFKKKRKNHRRDIQIKYTLEGITTPYIDKRKIKDFLDDIKYPIYYIDFETTSYVIPRVSGYRPNERLIYQYSLHIEYEDGRVEHKEYLADKIDCAYDIAKSLVENIPTDVNLVAYNKSVEEGCFRALAERVEEFSDRLLKIADNFKDLLVVFKNGYYYDVRQKGDNSIKAVMPVMAEEMANAYHELDVVHNGSEALTMFKALMDMKRDEVYDKTRAGMLDYCRLDTLSMVVIMNKLKEIVKDV